MPILYFLTVCLCLFICVALCIMWTLSLSPLPSLPSPCQQCLTFPFLPPPLAPLTLISSPRLSSLFLPFLHLSFPYLPVNLIACPLHSCILLSLPFPSCPSLASLLYPSSFLLLLFPLPYWCLSASLLFQPLLYLPLSSPPLRSSLPLSFLFLSSLLLLYLPLFLTPLFVVSSLLVYTHSPSLSLPSLSLYRCPRAVTQRRRPLPLCLYLYNYWECGFTGRFLIIAAGRGECKWNNQGHENMKHGQSGH